MKRIIVAAGGGGDAVAAAMLHAALYDEDEPPAVIFTYAWDRLLVDPTPGPRANQDFTGLRQLTPHVWAVPASASAKAPHGSTLPRLAAELPHTIALLDPYAGVVGITRQINELAEAMSSPTIDLLDVGGDILAHGDEPSLRSPLADALTLAASAQAHVDVRLLVAGPGLDGELPAETLQDRLGPPVAAVSARHVATIAHVLRWHPSEATALLAATAHGVRGLCEVRDAGLPVPLTDDSSKIYQPSLGPILKANALATALVGATSLDEAEDISRRVCGFSEIDYERAKAARLNRETGPEPTNEVLIGQLDEFEHAARSRGATHATMRRIAEALQVRGADRERLLRLLRARDPASATPSLWCLGQLGASEREVPVH